MRNAEMNNNKSKAMKRNLFKIALLPSSVLALTLLAPRATATPYASGINTNTPGSISYTLNENADDVKVIFDINTSTNDYPSQVKGTYTFSLGTATNYQIVVSKKAAAGYVQANGAAAVVQQLSVDSNPLMVFNSPRGVAINRNLNSPYFGRIYVANSAAGTVSGRAVQDGIYMMNADQTDALGLGNTASTGGFDLATDGSAMPYRLAVGPDDMLYICDWGDAKGNLYVTDPNVTATGATTVLKALFNQTGTGAESGNTPVGADNNHGSIASAYVEGSLAAGTLKVYTIDEDLQANKTQTTRNQEQSIWRYDVNAGPLPFGSDPTRIYTPSSAEGITFVDGVTVDMDRGKDGKWYYVTDRSSGTDTAGLIVRSSTGGTTLFNSRAMSIAMGLSTTTDTLLKSASMTVTPDQKFVSVLLDSGAGWILPLTNSVPDLSKRLTFAAYTAATSAQGHSIRCDAAGNLYAASASHSLVRIFSPGGTSITTYSNDVTGVNASFTVQRIDPDIFTAPQNITANAGMTATFTVTATGSGTLKYQWTRTGTNVSGATKSSLALANVQQAAASPDYAVVVTSAGGSITSSVVSLTVIDTAPIITTDLPPTKTVNAGTTNTFTIVTTGTDPRSYQWRFNGVPVPGATGTSYTRTDVQSANDQGTYDVVITNTVAPYSASSTLCVLTITETLPLFTVQPVNQTLGTGANATFSVTTTGTDPRSYQWYHNNVSVLGATSTSFTLTNIQTGNNGDTFFVVVNNPIAPATSTQVTLTVTNKAPTIITQPAVAVVDPSGNTNFTVVAQGQDTLSYQWRKDGTPISDGGIYSGATTATLSVTGAQLSDAGFYSVVVTDGASLSTTSASAQLVVTQTPFATGTGTGLLGEYRTVQVRTFTNAPTLTRIDTTVDTNYATGSPAPSIISVDNFTARWSGQVQPLYSQDYTFYDASDDGSRLWINGLLIVDHWVPQGITETASPTTLSLVAGQKYDLVMEYFEQTSTAEVHLRWSSASQLKQAIPMTQLYPATAPVQPKLSASVVGTDLVLQWMGSYTLQSAPDLNTAFSDVVTVTNIAPYNNGSLFQPQQYLRLKAY
jgi:hypothetical protein